MRRKSGLILLASSFSAASLVAPAGSLECQANIISPGVLAEPLSLYLGKLFPDSKTDVIRVTGFLDAIDYWARIRI